MKGYDGWQWAWRAAADSLRVQWRKSQANIEHLGAAFSLFTKRWHPRQEDDDMDGDGGRVYWSSLAGFGFIHHGWRSFFAVSPLRFPQGMVWARGLFFSVSIHITSPIRFNQFVSLLACFFFRDSTTHSTIDEGTE